MEGATEVRYAGVVLGRAAEVREAHASGVFVALAEPLPVGTPVVLKGEGGERAARVIEVIESADPAAAGMRVHFTGAAEPVAAPKPQAAPPPVQAAPPAQAAPPPPVQAAPPPPVQAAPAGVASEPSDSQAQQAAPGAPGSGSPEHEGGRRRRRRRGSGRRDWRRAMSFA
jgi:hypothetical protein